LSFSACSGVSSGQPSSVLCFRKYALTAFMVACRDSSPSSFFVSFSTAMAQSGPWKKRKPSPAYLLSNNNANIRRVRQRIEELSSRSEFAGWTFPGGEAKINEAENRLQLIFEEKPDANQRQELKSNGFKWAPSQGAWQRQLTRTPSVLRPG